MRSIGFYGSYNSNSQYNKSVNASTNRPHFSSGKPFTVDDLKAKLQEYGISDEGDSWSPQASQPRRHGKKGSRPPTSNTKFYASRSAQSGPDPSTLPIPGFLTGSESTQPPEQDDYSTPPAPERPRSSLGQGLAALSMPRAGSTRSSEEKKKATDSSIFPPPPPAYPPRPARPGYKWHLSKTRGFVEVRDKKAH